MQSSLWLFLMLPNWYFSSVGAPFAAAHLSAGPALGTIALLFGVVWGAIKRRGDLAVFLVLPAASQVLMIVAGLLRDRPAYTSPMWWLFPLLQLVVGLYFVYRLDGARLPAIALTVFSVTYAMLATFIAGMAISGTWL